MNSIAAIPLKSCNQCSHYRGGYCYGFGTAKKVFSTAEALLCGDTYTPLGQVQIGPLDSLAGQLSEFQIPSGIISTIKLADLAVTSAKLSDASVTLLKIVDEVITNAKIDPAAAIAESKLDLDVSTAVLATAIAANTAAIALRELLSNKDIANGYLGLDAGAKVPLAKLNPLTNTEIAAGAAIVESKLNLNYPTHSNSLDHAQSHTLASHSTKAHNELTDVLTSQHHVKTVSSEISLADLLEKNHANLTNVLASQHHVKYTDANAKSACVSNVAFGSGWNAVIDVAPSKNAVYDKLSPMSDQLDRRPFYPRAIKYTAVNGAGWNVSGGGHSVVSMPASDSDCSFRCAIKIPDDWPTTSGYLKVIYMMGTANNAYSVLWAVGSTAEGEVPSPNVLNFSSAWDFAGTNPAGELAINSINLSGLAGGDLLGIRCTSDASNGTVLYVFDVWLQVSA